MSWPWVTGLGYKIEDGVQNTVVDFGDFQDFIESQSFCVFRLLWWLSIVTPKEIYTTLQQWELGRFIHPQGPLYTEDISENLLQTWAQESVEDLHGVLCQHARDLYGDVRRPPPAPKSFWKALAILGGEDEASRQGKLIYRMIMTGNLDPKLILLSPSIDNSCRLWRTQPARRLLRVVLDAEYERKLQISSKSNLKTGFRLFIHRTLYHLGEAFPNDQYMDTN